MLHLVALPYNSTIGLSYVHIAPADTLALPAYARALCRRKPGPTSTGWHKASTEATCPVCLKRLEAWKKKGKI